MTIKQFSLLFFLVVIISSKTYAQSASVQFEQILDDHWVNANREQLFFRKDPDTFRMNGTLPDMSDIGRERRALYNQGIIKRLKGIQANALSPKDHQPKTRN